MIDGPIASVGSAELKSLRLLRRCLQRSPPKRPSAEGRLGGPPFPSREKVRRTVFKVTVIWPQAAFGVDRLLLGWSEHIRRSWRPGGGWGVSRHYVRAEGASEPPRGPFPGRVRQRHWHATVAATPAAKPESESDYRRPVRARGRPDWNRYCPPPGDNATGT